MPWARLRPSAHSVIEPEADAWVERGAGLKAFERPERDSN